MTCLPPDTATTPPPGSLASVLSAVESFLVQRLAGAPLAQGYAQWWIGLLRDNPRHLVIETVLILVILLILVQRPKKKTDGLWLDDAAMQRVLEERVKAFNPEPLAPATLSEDARAVLDDTVVVKSQPAASRVQLEGFPDSTTHVNFASADFLAYGTSAEVARVTERALDTYGVGSCGPRGFYGTIDAHVRLEEALAKAFGTDDAIIYSDASSAVSSAIPAFANRSDLLVVDAGVNDNVLTGVRLSRAKTVFFRHNDMAHLEQILRQVEADDKRLKRRVDVHRRFIVFEGLYRNYGDVAPLPEILRLKLKYKWRLMVDETLSVGTLGATGRGLTEHFNVPVSDVEILVAGMETTLASVGGFCVGSAEVVEHQRLSGAGYCFSASAPPFTAAVAQKALEMLVSDEGKLALKRLSDKAQRLHASLSADPNLRVLSDPLSPVVHVRLAKTFPSHKDESKAVRALAKRALQSGFLITPAYHVPVPERSEPPPPTLRLYIHVDHSDDELAKVSAFLRDAAAKA